MNLLTFGIWGSTDTHSLKVLQEKSSLLPLDMVLMTSSKVLQRHRVNQHFWPHAP